MSIVKLNVQCVFVFNERQSESFCQIISYYTTKNKGRRLLLNSYNMCRAP